MSVAEEYSQDSIEGLVREFLDRRGRYEQTALTEPDISDELLEFTQIIDYHGVGEAPNTPLRAIGEMAGYEAAEDVMESLTSRQYGEALRKARHIDKNPEEFSKQEDFESYLSRNLEEFASSELEAGE